MKEAFVPIPNRMFARESDFFTSNDEFLVFYHICTLVSARNPYLATLNIDILNSLIILDQKNQPRGKARIKDAILGLHAKNYIKVSHSDIALKNNTLLEITIPDTKHPIFTETVNSEGSNYKGFTAVTDDIFSSTDSVLELKVMIYVKWREKIDYHIAYKEWASVLGVCNQTAVNTINECVAKGLIFRLRGDYYRTEAGEIRQTTNQYTIADKTTEEYNPPKEINTALKSMGLKTNSIETRPNRWFAVGANSRIDEQDMYVYLTTTCAVLKEHAKKRISAISKSGAYMKKLMEDMQLKANDRLDKEKSNEHSRKVHLALSENNEKYMLHDDEDNEFQDHFRKVQALRANKAKDYSYLLD